MAKFNKTLRNKQTLAVKNTKPSIVEKRKKKENNEVSLSDIHKNNSKKGASKSKIAKNTYTNILSSKKKKQRTPNKKLGMKDVERSDVPVRYRQNDKRNSEVYQKVQISTNSKMKQKMKNKNKLDAKDTKRLDVPTKYPKDNKGISKVFQEVQTNTNVKYKKRNKKRKQDMNLEYVNEDAWTMNTKERNKELQMPAKNLDIERRKTKIEKLKKINEKKTKRISVKLETRKLQETKQEREPNKILTKLNEYKANVKQLEETFTSKSKPKLTQLSLRDRMMTQLRASRFRFINEILYNNDSSQSKHYFKTDPDSFMAYHAGYKQQLEQWAVNPLDVIISSIKKLPTDNVIADFGCGEARLAASVPHTVHSFDFIALNDRVKACDMAHTPLLMNSVHVVVFCLSLMGSNLNDYIIEANRVLKNNGILKIAEVESRFENVKNFIRLLRNYGFKDTRKDLSHKLFYFMDFRKEEDISMKRKNLPPITLKSCSYKKR